LILKLNCEDCDCGIEIPEDALKGEVVSCGDCGQEFEILKNPYGSIALKKTEVVGEDWGE
jgi:alpha-aminoadipate carrier protein LysW